MRYPASEKLEIIRLVERSYLSTRRTLDKLGIPRTTFYRWYERYIPELPFGFSATESSYCLRGIISLQAELLSVNPKCVTIDDAGDPCTSTTKGELSRVRWKCGGHKPKEQKKAK